MPQPCACVLFLFFVASVFVTHGISASVIRVINANHFERKQQTVAPPPNVTQDGHVYWLPDQYGEHTNQLLYQRGWKYSIHGFWVDSPARKPYEDGLQEEIATFTKLITPAWKTVFWTDTSPQSNYTCCHTQLHEYTKHGWTSGFDAKAYFTVATARPVGALTILQCRFDEKQQMNVIHEIGFGQGTLRTEGVVANKPFLMGNVNLTNAPTVQDFRKYAGFAP